jgi:hypothetical protein
LNRLIEIATPLARDVPTADTTTPLASSVRATDAPTTLVAHVRRADAMSVPWPGAGRDGRVSDMVLQLARRGRRFA